MKQRSCFLLTDVHLLSVNDVDIGGPSDREDLPDHHQAQWDPHHARGTGTVRAT